MWIVHLALRRLYTCIVGDIARRTLFVSERAMTTPVSNIERTAATVYTGVGLIRIYFQEGTNTDASGVPILQPGPSSGALPGGEETGEDFRRNEDDWRLGRKKRLARWDDRAHAFGVAGYFLRGS